MAPKFIFSNSIGSFVFNEKFKLIDGLLFKNIEQYDEKEKYEEKLIKKHGDLNVPDEEEIASILLFFKDKKYYSLFHEKNINITKLSIKNSVHEDSLIIQTTDCIEEIDRTLNLLTKRLREWYSLYNPEISYKVSDHEKFVALVIKKTKNQILKELKLNDKNCMGADLKGKDIDIIMLLATQINNLYKLKAYYNNYLVELGKKACPNFFEVAGTAIAAKLISHAGSLWRLAEMPASTIQILGAEKALFRHMRNKKRNLPPKFGIIHEHQLILKSEDKMKGKAARALADKLSIAIKIDFFKGKFIGDKLKKGLVDKFKIKY